MSLYVQSLYVSVLHTQEMLLSCRATVILSIFYTVLFFMPQTPIPPFTIGIPFFVMFNNMTSYVYRNMRFGFYQDYSIASSVIARALQGSGQSADSHQIVFEQPTSTKLEDGGDLKVEGEV